MKNLLQLVQVHGQNRPVLLPFWFKRGVAAEPVVVQRLRMLVVEEERVVHMPLHQ
jgi:hypothetical protein